MFRITKISLVGGLAILTALGGNLTATAAPRPGLPAVDVAPLMNKAVEHILAVPSQLVGQTAAELTTGCQRSLALVDDAVGWGSRAGERVTPCGNLPQLAVGQAQAWGSFKK